MNQDNHRETADTATGSEHAETTQAVPPKQAPGSLNLNALALTERVYTVSLTVPDMKPLSNDRRGRHDALEARRELGKIALKAAKFAMATDAVVSVAVHGYHAFERGQGKVMDIYYGRSRYPEMNEMAGQMAAQTIHQIAAGISALTELHTKRQAEEL